MITIAGLGMRNWRCFKGEQTLALEPTFYAMIARGVDPDRSNGFGKSSILGAIDWCLHGRMPEDCRRKIDLITRGEKSLEISTTLSSGHRIVRTFSTTSPESVKLIPPDANKTSIGDEAQAQIAQLVGLSKEDFLLCYMRQREMARMVSMEPSDRMTAVSSWVRLEPVERCEDDAAGVLEELAKRVSAKQWERRDAESVVRAELERHGCGSEPLGLANIEKLQEKAKQSVVEIERFAIVLDDMRRQREGERDRARLRDDAVRYDAIVAQGSEIAARIAKSIWKTEEIEATALRLGREVAQLATAHGLVASRMTDRRRIATGQFDGQCPIAGAPCPSKLFVVDTVVASHERFKQDESKEEAARIEHEKKTRMHNAAIDALRTRKHDEQRLADLRDEARRLKLAKEKYAALTEAAVGDVHDMAAISNAEMALEGARRSHALQVASLQTIEVKTAQMGQIEIELLKLEKAMRIAAAGVAIFGKGGAQRRMAEGALADIEDRANHDVLAESGIDLSVRVVWSRETKGLAVACEGCGAPFPTSKRVKTCERCGTARGPQLTNKLELEPSDRSGGLDDLAGFAFQVGASAWLRQDRLAGWGVAMLDELFGQLDVAYRKALGQHLPGLLGRAGFGQGLVIAHHASVLDALPGRIEIVSDGCYSTARVV